MAPRNFLYLLGASLTIAGCFFPWSCHQVGDLSWSCPTAIMLRYSMHGDFISRLEIQDNARGSGYIILFLTIIIVFFAFFAPQFIRRPKIIVITSSAALVLVSVYHFITTLTALIQDREAFTGIASLTLAIVCIGALMMLAAGVMDQRAMRQHLA
jgi:presenilin-like A22 family membrane protease